MRAVPQAALLLFALLTAPLARAETLFPPVPKEFRIFKDKVVELKNLPPVRDQDGVNACGIFSTASLLEFHRCRVKRIPCRNTKVDERISALQLASLDEAAGSPGIHEKVGPREILETIAKNRTRLVPEKCAPFDQLLATIRLDGEEVKLDQVRGMNVLRDLYQDSRSNHSCEACVQKLQTTLANQFGAVGKQLQADLPRLAEALRQASFEEFAYRLLIPPHCLAKAEPPPPFERHSYPATVNDKADKKVFRDILVGNLKRGLASEATLCVQPDKTKGCGLSHSVLVVGSREMCGLKGCRLSFKIQNSWGKTWQEKNEDGWIDGEWLLDRMMMGSVGAPGTPDRVAMNWIR
ncbi:MAG: hypothetical protein NDJ90_12950 [Oligoflexia bacterium]|nr:hypothetical protein [Oligoflexia bacterium]